MQFLLSYDDNDDVYTRVRPYDLQKSMMINKDVKNISKTGLSLEPSELDIGRC